MEIRFTVKAPLYIKSDFSWFSIGIFIERVCIKLSDEINDFDGYL